MTGMKRMFFSLLLAATGFAAGAQQFTLSDPAPQGGKPLTLRYDPSGGPLAKLANVKCVAYTFINTKQKVVDIPLSKEGDIYTATFTPADSTSIAVFGFSADGTRDQNPKGYYTLFYRNGQPTDMAFYWEAQYYNGMGKAFVGAESDKSKAIDALERGFALYPTLKDTYGLLYFNLLYGADKAKAEPMIRAEITRLKTMTDKKETDWTKMANLYNLMKSKASADSVFAIIKSQYPSGAYAFNQAAGKVYNAPSAAEKETALSALIRDFKLDPAKAADATRLDGFYGVLADAWAAEKNNAKFEEFAKKISSKMGLAAAYNNYAWASAEKKENTEFAMKISKASLDLLQAAKNDPVPAFYASKEDYIKELENNYALYADTYAFLLSTAGKDAEALQYQELAVNGNNFSNDDMNARYVTLLVKNKQNDKALSFAERFVKDGKGSDQMKADLKAVYHGNSPFEAYYAALEKESMEKEKAKFIKDMLNMPAPKFSLKNLKGETVSLEKLKGKVVIVDYWATWCGPCVASFPGMQKAVDKYKNDPNVAFLFINTWQTEENREKVVKDFIAGTPYTFNVLLDTKNKQDPSKFDVIEQYKVEGIPTKFIIDGEGNIRFKKVGFGGSADGTVKELDMMIALAKEKATK